MSHYDTLGVSENATQDEIKKAYRKLSKEYHPDVSGGDDLKFKEIAEAYSIIGDKDKKVIYDNKQRQEDFFTRFNKQDRYTASDMFDQVFGNAFNSQQRRQKGDDIRVQIHVSFDEAFHGTTKTFDINGHNIRINFKPGLKTGQRFRIPERGAHHQLNTSLPNGDLIIEIHVIHDATFILQGNDIWIEKAIPWYDLMLGCTIPTMTPDGMINLKVPKGTTPEKTLRLKDKGYPVYNTNKHGDLLVKIHASYHELNEEQLEYIKKIKKLYDV